MKNYFIIQFYFLFFSNERQSKVVVLSTAGNAVWPKVDLMFVQRLGCCANISVANSVADQGIDKRGEHRFFSRIDTQHSW